MNRRIIRITEGDIKQMVMESIRMLTEHEGLGGHSSSASEGLEFEIPMYNDYEIAHFKAKLLELKRKAISAGGDINFTITTVTAPVEKIVEDGRGGKKKEVVMEDFAHFNIVPSTPAIQMPGYKYIGSIVPMSIDIDGEKKETMIVSLSKEFEGNDELRNELKNSSMRMTCDGCHREASRGIYYCFIEENSGRVLKLGTQCAAKYFGIDVGKKIQILFSALASLGNEPYVIYDPDGFPVDKIREPRTGTLQSEMDKGEAIQFQNMILRGCMAIAEYGPYCNMKTSMTHATTLENLMDNARKQSIFGYGEKARFNEHVYKMKIEELKEQYPELFEFRKQALELSHTFMSEGAKFFFYLEPQSEFDEKIKNIGLLITGGSMQKKQIGKFSYLNFIPYCVSKFFKAKADSDPANAENAVKPLAPFDGLKQFDVTVTTLDKKQTRNGKDYYKAIAVTSDNEEVSWNIFRGEPTFNRGDKLRISGTYNQTYRSLDNVKVLGVGNEQPQAEATVEINYPADGTRYRNENFNIIKLTQNYLVVKNVRDNCEYYISNVSEAYGYYGVTREKFDLSQLAVGDNVTLTGTVASYVSQRTGQKGYKLLRVSGLPQSGKRLDY
jgi:hypothetical protein